MKSPNEKVNAFLIEVEATFSEKSKTVEKIRNIFFELNPEIEEAIKYGGITFNVLGQLIGGIYVYKKHISIEFSDGANFNDDDGLLEGKGKCRRHFKILEDNDIKAKNLRSYIKQAVNTEMK